MDLKELCFKFYKDQSALVRYCMDVGLIASERPCRVCGEKMTLYVRKERRDEYEWRCRQTGKNKAHRVYESIRKNSWFSQSKLSMFNILYITYMWCARIPNHVILKETKCSPDTLADWKSFCREVCVEYCLLKSEKIGGPSSVIEIGESEFGRRIYSNGKSLTGTWVFGGIDTEAQKCFFRVVSGNSRASLLGILKEWVAEGTVIYSDCWKTYETSNDKAFKKLSVSHNFQFKDPDSGVNFTWSGVKRSYIGKRYVKKQVDSYFAEYICRKVLEKSDFYEKFVEIIHLVFDLNADCSDSSESENDQCS